MRHESSIRSLKSNDVRTFHWYPLVFAFESDASEETQDGERKRVFPSAEVVFGLMDVERPCRPLGEQPG